jgi:hypothetical protein
MLIINYKAREKMIFTNKTSVNQKQKYILINLTYFDYCIVVGCHVVADFFVIHLIVELFSK